MSIARIVNDKIGTLKAGAVFSANDFVDLGSKGNIDIILHRLCNKGVVRQLGYGLYDLPRKSALLGNLSPDMKDIIDAYSRKMGQHFVLDPLNAANALGVTTQVPARLIFLTDGKSHTLRICNVDIYLVHASPKVMAGASTPIGVVIQALRYFGSKGAPIGAIQKIAHKLSQDDISTLLALRGYVLQNLLPSINRISQVAKVY